MLLGKMSEVVTEKAYAKCIVIIRHTTNKSFAVLHIDNAITNAKVTMQK